MRQLLYILAGFLAGLIGVLVSHFILLTPIIDNILVKINLNYSSLILFPITSSSIAVSMVLAEIFLNNPTRIKDNLEVLGEPTKKAILIGITSGLVAAILLIFVGETTTINASPFILIGWILVGATAGAADGFSWQFRTIEGGQKTRAITRLFVSITGGIFSGIIAFSLSQLLSSKFSSLSDMEIIIGFIILGIVLALVLSQASAASLCFALRAGAGFELDDRESNFSRIRNRQLRFNFKSPHAQEGYEKRIEEGISIELPNRGKITIGSSQDSHIYVSVLPPHCAEIIINDRQVAVKSLKRGYVIVDNKVLGVNKIQQLKHNQILTFRAVKQELSRIKIVRFVFYDRFLDPQA